jgi:hypothetical protein
MLMISPCCLSACVSSPHIVLRQRLGKHIPAASNTHATIEEFLASSSSLRSVLYQKKVSD